MAAEWENAYQACLKPQVLAPALCKRGVVVHIFNLLRSEDRRTRSLRSSERACRDRYKSEELVPTPIPL